MMSRRRQAQIRLLTFMVLTFMVAATAGCGSRRSSGDLRAAAGLTPSGDLALAATRTVVGGGDAPAAAGPVASTGQSSNGASAPPGGAGTAAAAAPGPATGGPGAGTTPGSATAATSASRRPVGGSSLSGSSVSGSSRPDTPAAKPNGPASSGEQAGGGPGPAPAVPRSPVLIGNVGTYTGPAGSSLTDLPEAVQVWVKWANDRGGVNGHQVKLVVADDGGDQARHRSLVQQLVETQGVIALIGDGEVITGASSVEYLTRKGIPVIGNEGGSDWFYSSPTYFTHVATGQTYWKAVASSVASVAKAKGKVKWAAITCPEATTCADADRVWTKEGEVKGQGLEPVYSARASIAQPDYTAECLNARNAGAEILTMVMDAASVRRIAASCARQNYRPLFTEVAASSKTEHASDPNLAGGLISSIGHFVWTDASTPAAAEFQAAIKKYLGKPPGAGHASGWAAARVFEKAAADLGEPPTAQAVLDGLWSFQGETLGGLVMPLTFTRGQNAPRQICWATNYAEGGQWTAFDGGRISCR
jgi:branched-chain amino acid transport system substrate-binding protein